MREKNRFLMIICALPNTSKRGSSNKASEAANSGLNAMLFSGGFFLFWYLCEAAPKEFWMEYKHLKVGRIWHLCDIFGPRNTRKNERGSLAENHLPDNPGNTVRVHKQHPPLGCRWRHCSRDSYIPSDGKKKRKRKVSQAEKVSASEVEQK